MLFICTLLLIIVAVAGIYIYRLYNRSYQSYQVMKTVKNPGGQAVGYLKYGNAVVEYNKDGVVAVDKNGKQLWNGSYNMVDPIADTRGNYVAVADRGNKLIHVYNQNGDVGSIKTLHNILKVQVATQGVVAVLMQEGETNYIKFYYLDGTTVSEADEEGVLVDKATDVGIEGYPIDMALSDDGKKLVVVNMSVTTGEIVSTVGFWNFGEVGKNYVDNFVGGYKFKGVIIPKVTFLNNDTVCVYKENGMMIYSIPEKPKLIHTENVNKKIESIIHNDKYTGMVLGGDTSRPKQLLLYDLKGNKILDKQLDFKYDKISLLGDEIIMHDNVSCLILKSNGKEKFNYTFDRNIDAFYPTDSKDHYILVDDKDVSEVMLK